MKFDIKKISNLEPNKIYLIEFKDDLTDIAIKELTKQLERATEMFGCKFVILPAKTAGVIEATTQEKPADNRVECMRCKQIVCHPNRKYNICLDCIYEELISLAGMS